MPKRKCSYDSIRAWPYNWYSCRQELVKKIFTVDGLIVACSAAVVRTILAVTFMLHVASHSYKAHVMHAVVVAVMTVAVSCFSSHVLAQPQV